MKTHQSLSETPLDRFSPDPDGEFAALSRSELDFGVRLAVGREGSGECKRSKGIDRKRDGLGKRTKDIEEGRKERQEKGMKSALTYLDLLKTIQDPPLPAECTISMYQNRQCSWEWHSSCVSFTHPPYWDS